MQAGDFIPLYNQLSDYNTGKYLKAFVRDQNGVQLASSPAILTHISDGLYANNSSIMFPTGITAITVQYIVYDDPGYTMISTSEGGSSDSWSISQGNVWNKTG